MKTLPGTMAFVWILAGFSLFAQQLFWIGTLGGGRSEAWDVSDNGRYVVGRSQAGDGKYYAFRWDRQTKQLESLGSFGGTGGVRSEAYRISGDGRFVVGYALDELDQEQAFLWDAASKTLEKISPNQTFGTFAYGISADGRFIVGSFEYDIPDEYRRGFVIDRYRDTVYRLETLGGKFSAAINVSPDGQYVVGFSQTSNGFHHAFRWETATGKMQDLGTLGNFSEAAAVSNGGAYVVGISPKLGTHPAAFLWIAAQDSMMHIGPSGTTISRAADISADGRYVVGSGAYFQLFATLWDFQRDTVYNLNERYAALLDDGSELLSAKAISADGRYIVGLGKNGTTGQIQGFLLDTQAPAAVVDPPSLFSFSVSPNPFQERVVIQLVLRHAASVHIRVCDLFGTPVRTLVEQHLPPGQHAFAWNGRSDDAQLLSAGAYLCKIVVDGRVVFAVLHLIR